MAEALIADFQRDFRDVHFPRVQSLAGTFDAQAAQMTLQGAAGFRADAAGQVVGGDADLLGDGGQIEPLEETFQRQPPELIRPTTRPNRRLFPSLQWIPASDGSGFSGWANSLTSGFLMRMILISKQLDQ
jgi:hypothetical protein